MHPRARRQHLIVEEIDRELLVYDTVRHRAHRLNESSALIWRLCDGRRTIDDIRRLVESTLHVPVSREVVWLVLGRLEEARLLDQALLRPRGIPAVSRRQALAMGLAGAAALLLEGCGVDSTTAPTPSGRSAPAPGAISTSSGAASPFAEPSASPSPFPSPFPSPSPSPAPSPSPSPTPVNCEGKHMLAAEAENIDVDTCVQRQKNQEAEEARAKNQTGGDADNAALARADALCAALNCAPKKCVRQGKGYELKLIGCIPTTKTCPEGQKAYTCHYHIVWYHCRCVAS